MVGKILGGRYELLEKINKTLENLAEKNTCSDGSIFMFAVGDGNHSLATAKAVWDEYKQEQLKAGVSEEQLKDCPIRYALTEIVNIYDDGLTFEPIHRVLFNVDSEKLINYCKDNLNGTIKDVETSEELEKLIAESKADFGFVNKENGKTKYRCLSTNITDLAVSRLQPTLDIFLKAVDMHAAYLHGKSPEIDYIHGSDEVFRLGEIENAVTILLPPIAKDSFFSTIAGNGPLPRKSFSMGEASEKRFYLEARNLF